MSARAAAPVAALGAAEARRLALRAQGLVGAAARGRSVGGLLRVLGAVQLDTISVLARSHELVPFARLGPVGREAVERAWWGGDAFEYWAHAACVLPLESWPLYAFRRRALRARGRRWHRVPEHAPAAVLRALRERGPLTTRELGGAKAGGEWWDWSEAKVAVEWLLDIGEVACVRRIGWRRVYDLPERAVPGPLLEQDPGDEACLRALVEQAGAALGVATRADLADYHRLRGEQVDAVVADTPLVRVEVEGWGAPAWAHPAALSEPVRGRHRTALLSPFDSLVWDRRRTARVFRFDHRLEAYVPAPKREHGYFAMPLLAGGHLVGRVDPKREGATLHARQVSLEPRAVGAMAHALREAAGWVGCDHVAVGVVDPPALAAPLRAALA